MHATENIITGLSMLLDQVVLVGSQFSGLG